MFTSLLANMGQSTNLSVEVGDLFGGGYVAYIYQPGDAGYVTGEQHGIIASGSDLLGTGQPYKIKWDNDSTYTDVTTSTSLAQGLTNTSNIIASLGTGGEYAARLCRDLNLGGYTDWSLPSLDEFEKIRENRYLWGIQSPESACGAFCTEGVIGYYWTSSQVDLDNAYSWYISASTPESGLLKNSSEYVRAVRYF